ncbi:MAG: adenylate/guanylate cyclase domain-containing protein, partial [Bacteroidota bacterium]
EVIIFMFLDLQESTSIAEQLGHIRYSKLIQDCFSDLGVVLESQAEIYQYVGDEAVLIWKHRDGVHHQQCLEAFYRFKQALISREAYYRQQYNCLPFFKAGVHGGLVTVTEVGRYKKEIAYHGDAVNTAARIQGQCNAFGEELLTSAELAASLEGGPYSFRPLGQVPLKGKKQAVEICAVSLDKASVSA